MKKITLNKKSLITILMLLLIQAGWSQSSPCIVYDDITLEERVALGISEQEWLMNKNTVVSSKSILSVPNNYVITPKQFRVNFWSVMNDNGTDGVRVYYDMAVKYLNRLNKIYEPYQICFVLNGNGVLKSTSHMNGKFYSDLKEEGILKGAYVDDAINIYIVNSIAWGAYGMTNYFSNAIALKESPMWNNEVLLAHEVGHALNLMHTHGDYNTPPNGSAGSLSSCEHVTRDPNDSNYNARTNGDEVHDTAADPCLFSNPNDKYYNFDTNTCTYIGNQTDCQGTPYSIDDSVITNIMSYGPPSCQNSLTQGQAERIHYYIDTKSIIDAPIKKALISTNNLSGFDLMVRNTQDDFGYEPDTISEIFWQSPDIWVRTANDDVPWHENPEYGVGNNYVKVRVVNRGCAPSDGTGKLKLYWTKAGTNLPMQVWNGSISLNGVSMGGLIGEADLPVLNSYEEHIFTFPWSVPNPDDFSSINEPWHFCLMAKIETPNDVSALPEHNGIYYNYSNSNNIALHNVNVMKTTAANSGKIYIGNFEPIARNVKLKLRRYRHDFTDTNIFNEAEIKFTFDSKLWNIWQDGGFTGTNVQFFGDKTIVVHEDSEIILKNFPANNFGILNVKVNFLTAGYTSNTDFGFNVEQWNQNTNTLMGGELYLVQKEERALFDADATVVNNTLSAIPINEPAAYNWYDANGTLLHTGQNYTVNNVNGTYLLEVIADYDGFKDTKKVSVAANNTSLLHNIYPNPATNNVTLQYNQLNCNHAYVMLINVNTNATSNYILDLNYANINLNTSQFRTGVYRVVLVCDNNVIESHNLIIQ